MRIPKIKCSNPHCDNYFDPNYEGVSCQWCEKEFCNSCEDKIIKCEICGISGCENCIKLDKKTGFFVCSNECLKEIDELETLLKID